MAMNILSMNGMACPNFINSLGNVAEKSQHEKLLQNFKNVLLCPLGSLIGDPAFGSRLHEYLFEPTTEALGNKIKNEINRAITQSYNFIEVQEVNVTLNEFDIRVSIIYILNTSDLSVNLEFSLDRRSNDELTV